MTRKAEPETPTDEPKATLTFDRELQYGMHGDDVKALQSALKQKGFVCRETGSFDVDTVKALRMLQHTKKLPENSIFGKTDFEALMEV